MRRRALTSARGVSDVEVVVVMRSARLASFTNTRRRTIMASPRNDAATGLNLDKRDAGDAEGARHDDLDVEGDDHDEDRHPEGSAENQSERATAVTSPERRMLTTMKILAEMLWVVALATAPQARAEGRLPVHRPAAIRSRRPASAFSFSVRIHIPAMKRPRPSALPARSLLVST